MIGKHTAAALRCLLLTICCLGLVTLGTHAQEATVTVEQYGAVGDGVTDDAKAIEAALNSGAEKVVFGAGKTYLYKQRMIMTASGVELDGNGAVLLWDRDTPQETWEQLQLFGSREAPVENVSIHDLSFESPNVEGGNGVQLLLCCCSGVQVSHCTFLAYEGKGNLQPGGGQGVTNIWIYGACHRITVEDCTMKNLTHASGILSQEDPEAIENGAGGNIWVSGFTEEAERVTLSDIVLRNNTLEKSCHDESIALWAGHFKGVWIEGNTFDLHEQGEVLVNSDVIFTLGNDVRDSLTDVHVTGNTIYGESRWSMFNCLGSGAVELSGNHITWVKVGSGTAFNGILDTRAHECAVLLKDNRLRCQIVGSGGIYKLFSSWGLEITGNLVETEGNLNHLCDLDDIDVQGETESLDSGGDTTSIYGNYFAVSSPLGMLYEGYAFYDNTVVLNGTPPDTLFSLYHRKLVQTPLLRDNDLYLNGIYTDTGTPKAALRICGCALGEFGVDFSGNTIDSTAEQDPHLDDNLVHLLENVDETEAQIHAENTWSSLFHHIRYYKNSRNPVVHTDEGEKRDFTVLTAERPELLQGAVSYALPLPPSAESFGLLACYDGEGRMTACLPLEALPRIGRGTLELRDTLESGAVSEVKSCKLFLLGRETLRPLCFPWSRGQ